MTNKTFQCNLCGGGIKSSKSTIGKDGYAIKWAFGNSVPYEAYEGEVIVLSSPEHSDVHICAKCLKQLRKVKVDE